MRKIYENMYLISKYSVYNIIACKMSKSTNEKYLRNYIHINLVHMHLPGVPTTLNPPNMSPLWEFSKIRNHNK